MPQLLTLVLFLLTFAACGPKPDPHTVDPGDQGAIGWLPVPQMTGPVIDCGGATRGSLIVTESGTTVRNCRIEGVMRVRGEQTTANTDWMRTSSRFPDHVSRVRAQAPAWVTVENVEVVSTGATPFYVGPGTSMLELRNVRVSGPSGSVALYLGAESYGTHGDVTIDASQLSREAIAVDASDFNDLEVDIENAWLGGIYFYRNCGEFGTARHATPSDNRFVGIVMGAETAVWLGSREGNRNYCDDDADGQYGSSISDYDHSRRNKVSITTDGVVRQGSSASDNEVEQL